MSEQTSNPTTIASTNMASPSLLRNEIDSRIVKIRPMSTPLDQISRCAGSRHSGSMVVDYYSVAAKSTGTTVKTAVSAPEREAGQETVELDIEVAQGSLFDPTETILFPTVPYADSKGNEEGFVTGVVLSREGNKLHVMLLNFGADGRHAAGEIPKGAKVVRMGRAATELAVQSPMFEALPVKDSNFCQIFKMQVERSTMMKLANKEVGWNFSDQEEVAIIDMRLGMEKNFLFGRKARVTHPETHEEIFLTGGIWSQTSRTFFYPKAGITDADVVKLCREAFTRNCGSHRKILIAGTGLMQLLSQIQGVKVIRGSEPMVKWGLEFHELVSNFGRLYLIHSEIFDECGHENDGFVLDPEYITKYSHIPFRTDRLDLRGAGVRNTDATVITEASCLVLRYPDAHMRVVASDYAE